MISKLDYKQKEKIIIIVTVVSLILVFSGITYAYFTANNPQGSTASIIAQSGRMLINYDDGTDNILPITDIQPSNNIIVDKTFSLTGINTTANNGLNMPFSISLEYQNTFQDYELQYFLKRIDTNENVSCTLKGFNLINEEMNSSIFGNFQYPESLYGYMNGAISDWSGNTSSQEIAYGYFSPSSNEQTITFNLKMMFPDTGHNQDYNKGATFNGKIVVSGQKADTFATDSWETIANNVNSGKASIYRVGSEKEVEIDGTNYTVRVANNSTPGECGSVDFSETACGFVVEFADVVELRPMNSSNTNSGGWPAAEMREYANGEFFNKLPTDLQSVIRDTKVISETNDGNLISTDKIYLLSYLEIWNVENDSSSSEVNYTRQLDYYKSKNVILSGLMDLNINIAKNYGNLETQGELAMLGAWWLRSFISDTFCMASLINFPLFDAFDSNEYSGFSPAFRIGKIETGNLVAETSQFTTDSWETIANNVKAGNASIYTVGSQKEVEIDGVSYIVRVANNSTPEECNGEDFSETACGFVVEFVDIVDKMLLNYGSNIGGWPAIGLRAYANGEFFNKLPTDLQNVIIETKVVSGHGSEDTSNFTSIDKIYFLSGHEVWEDGTNIQVSSYDTAYNNTRQLDYYQSKGVSGTIKKYNGSSDYWLLRTAYSYDNVDFILVGDDGELSHANFPEPYGFAPAFRIGESSLIQRDTVVETIDKLLLNQDSNLTEPEIFSDNTLDRNVRFNQFYDFNSPNNINIFGKSGRILGIFNVKNADTGESERLVKVQLVCFETKDFDTNGTNNWETSSLMQDLNSEENLNYYNQYYREYFGDNDSYTGIIANVEWDIGGLDSLNISLDDAYKQERGLTPYTTNKKTWTGKIGLPSLTDYLYSTPNLECANNLSTCPPSTNSYDWNRNLTMIKDNTSTTNVYMYDDYTNSLVTTTRGYACPTFYLKKDVEFVHGVGTSYNPYLIFFTDTDYRNLPPT